MLINVVKSTFVFYFIKKRTHFHLWKRIHSHFYEIFTS